MKKYDTVIIIISLFTFNYFLMSLEANTLNIANWGVYIKLNFQAYCVFDLIFGGFYYLAKKV